MKNLLTISFFLLSFTVLSGKKFDPALLTFPSFNSVVDHYSTLNTGASEGNLIEFAKKPNGYHIIEKNILNNEVVSDHLFWSLEEQTFLPQLNKNKNSGKFIPNDYYPLTYAFDHALYYNYPEANNESIRALEGIKKLPDLMLEALARAYSGKSDEINGLVTPDVSKVKMTLIEMEGYLVMAQKTLSTYKRLHKQNPNYETIVGTPHTKFSNESMNFWFVLMTNAYPEKAKEFLTDQLYDPIMLNFAKNLLTTCGKNAILFTLGDNDTYPLWYVQEKLNFRSDVAVINTGFANIPFYNNYHVQKYGLKTILEPIDYENDRLKYIGISKIKEPALSIVDFIFSFKKENDSEALKYDDSEILYQKYSNLSCELQSGDSVIFALDNGFYTFSDLFILDLIGSNAAERPIVFAAYYHPIAKTTDDKKFNLLSYEINAGIRDKKYIPYSRSFEDVTGNYKMVKNEFVFENKQSKSGKGNQIIYNYTLLFSTLSRNLHLINKTTEAKDLLVFLEATYPITNLKEGGSLAFYQAQIWNEIGEKNKAIMALEASFTILEKTIELNPDAHERIDQTLLYIEQFCEKNDLDYIDKIKTLRLKLSSF